MLQVGRTEAILLALDSDAYHFLQESHIPVYVDPALQALIDTPIDNINYGKVYEDGDGTGPTCLPPPTPTPPHTTTKPPPPPPPQPPDHTKSASLRTPPRPPTESTQQLLTLFRWYACHTFDSTALGSFSHFFAGLHLLGSPVSIFEPPARWCSWVDASLGER